MNEFFSRSRIIFKERKKNLHTIFILQHFQKTFINSFQIQDKNDFFGQGETKDTNSWIFCVKSFSALLMYIFELKTLRL